MVKKIILFFIAFSIIGCAKRGTPNGGPKDEDPPVFIRSHLQTTLQILIQKISEFTLMNI